ncbi:DUF1624 domain-containing protein [Candidatus Micrarchaeota archaeon]|nr:DUF1624 domain-containing protein [Candidatus Micrarchaeota archaeon]
MAYGQFRAKERWIALDAIRGIIFLGMVLYHLLFDLVFFKEYPVELYTGFWYWMARSIAGSFLFIAGISLVLSDSRLSLRHRFGHHMKRGFQILGAGILITVVTMNLFPENTIWFGILHAIALCIILFWPLTRHPKRAGAAALIVLVIIALLPSLSYASPWLIWFGFPPAGFQSFDYVPLIPWSLPFLLGISTAPILLSKLPKAQRSLRNHVLARSLAWFGRRTLVGYLIHQPILVSLVLMLA